MTKYLLLVAAAAFLWLNTQAQDFKQSVEKTFIAFDTTRNNVAKRTELGNKLALIAKKWPDEWSAHYYNAYGKVMLSYEEKDEARRDAVLNEADASYQTMMDLLKKETDETHVLAAMIANARMTVNPQQRWQKYGKLFEDHLKAAKELNADNPRIYYLQGSTKYFTPKAFGGGKKAALPYFEKAEGLFAKENVTDITRPHWGKESNAYFLKMAQQPDEN